MLCLCMIERCAVQELDITMEWMTLSEMVFLAVFCLFYVYAVS